MKIYLQQFIAQASSVSRRQSTQLIKDNKVRVNNQLAELGQKVDPAQDKVKLNNKLIKAQEHTVYYLVNKPVGYTSTMRDRHASKKVVDLVPKTPKVWPVGRLDKDSHGLIILTNDGQLTHQLTHPSFKHPKEYIVSLNKPITPSLLSNLTKGVKLEEGIAKADKLKKLSSNKFSLIIHQGWHRQIRRMLDKLGYKATDLERIRVAKIKLDNLKSGSYKKLSEL